MSRYPNNLDYGLYHSFKDLETLDQHLGVADKLLFIRDVREILPGYNRDPDCKNKDIHDACLHVFFEWVCGRSRWLG